MDIFSIGRKVLATTGCGLNSVINIRSSKEFRSVTIETDDGFLIVCWNYLHPEQCTDIFNLDDKKEIIRRYNMRGFAQTKIAWVMGLSQGTVSKMIKEVKNEQRSSDKKGRS